MSHQLTLKNETPDTGYPYVFLLEGEDASFTKIIDPEFNYGPAKSRDDNLADDISGSVIQFFPELKSDRATVAPDQTVIVVSKDGPLHLAISLDVYATDVNQAGQFLAGTGVELLETDEDQDEANAISGCLNVVRQVLYASKNANPPPNLIAQAFAAKSGYEGGSNCKEAFNYIISGGKSDTDAEKPTAEGERPTKEPDLEADAQ